MVEPTPDLAALAARLDALEDSVRRARSLALVAAVIAIAALVLALVAPGAPAESERGVIVAREVQVHGPEGDAGATLGVGPDGTPYLAFRHRDGVVRVGMGVPADGLPSLVLLDATGQVRFMAP